MLGTRRGRPSLIGRAAQTAARTAVISATATAVSGRVAGRQPAAPAQPVAPVAEPITPAPTAGLTDEAIARLKQLAELHAAGILTVEEFAEQKARLLA
jgi:Short C-terminal domain